MKKNPYFLNTVLAIVVFAACAIALLVRVWFPAAVIPALNIPNMVLLSVIALLVEHFLAPMNPRCYICIRGVNVFPSQIETVLLNEGYEPNYQIVVDRKNNTDTFEVNVEMTADKFTDKVGDILKLEKSLAAAMRAMLGINPAVHLVAPKSIARSEGKAVRVIDKRKLI